MAKTFDFSFEDTDFEMTQVFKNKLQKLTNTKIFDET